MQLARISFDILGVIPARPSRVEVRTTRPGRTIELVEATLSVDDRVAVRAQAWRLATHDSAPVAGVELDGIPGPDDLVPWDGADTWRGGYIRGLEFRIDPRRRPGRTIAWIRTSNALVHGETCSPTADLVRLVDTANGIAVRVSPDEWMFPNVDLAIHLFREPVRGLGRVRHASLDGHDRARRHVDDAARRAGTGRSGRAGAHRATTARLPVTTPLATGPTPDTRVNPSGSHGVRTSSVRPTDRAPAATMGPRARAHNAAEDGRDDRGEHEDDPHGPPGQRRRGDVRDRGAAGHADGLRRRHRHADTVDLGRVARRARPPTTRATRPRRPRRPDLPPRNDGARPHDHGADDHGARSDDHEPHDQSHDDDPRASPHRDGHGTRAARQPGRAPRRRHGLGRQGPPVAAARRRPDVRHHRRRLRLRRGDGSRLLPARQRAARRRHEADRRGARGAPRPIGIAQAPRSVKTSRCACGSSGRLLDDIDRRLVRLDGQPARTQLPA